ncbi:MAG: serine/threonine protein kinase [Anaerolineae bacterium]|nr:serine/threonine protein kinase [Anaerolineae bacterium]
MTNMIGRLIGGRYRIEGNLGRGRSAYGDSYRAIDTNLDREVALKLLPRTLELQNPHTRARFNREVNVLKALDNAHIIKVLDAGDDEEYGVYLVSDFKRGGNLRTYLEGHARGLKREDFFRLFVPLADAIDYIHRKGILHRDLKPENVVLDDTNAPHLVDFGISYIFDGTDITRTGDRIPGTFAYMAPELFDCKGMPSKQSDIYSFGVMIYEVLEGNLPFEGTERQVIAGHLALPIPDPLVMREKMGDEFVKIITEKVLTKDPRDRPASANKLLNELSIAVYGEKIPANFVTSSLGPNGWLRYFWIPLVGSLVVLIAALITSFGPKVYDTLMVRATSAAGLRGTKTAEAKASGTTVELNTYTVEARETELVQARGAESIVAQATKTADEQVIETPTPTYSPIPTATTTATPAASSTPYLTATPTSTATDNLDATGTSYVETQYAVIIATRAAQRATMYSLLDEALADYGKVPQFVEALHQTMPSEGPVSGGLAHEENDFLEIRCSYDSYKDFIAEVTFTNPYSANFYRFSFGFLFRYDRSDNHYRLYVVSPDKWVLNNWTGTDSYSITQNGTFPINTEENGTNSFLMVAKGNQGLLIVNGIFVSQLDLSHRENFGEVCIGIGMVNNSELNGFSTGFQDFSLWHVQ